MKKTMVIIFLLPIICFATEYTVVKGDCLWNIAKRFYNNPFLWKQIYNANQQKIKNPDLIYPGQVFVLPGIEVSSEEIDKEIYVGEEDTVEEMPTPEISEEVRHEEEIKLEEVKHKGEIKEEQVEIIKEEIKDEEKEYDTKKGFIKAIKLKDFKMHGQIVSGEKEKFVYIDFDKVYCQLKEDIEVSKGKILGVYHLGPSKYDVNLMKVPKDQLTLVGKVRVIKVLKDKKILCEIIRTYSPIVIGDFITLPEN